MSFAELGLETGLLKQPSATLILPIQASILADRATFSAVRRQAPARPPSSPAHYRERARVRAATTAVYQNLGSDPHPRVGRADRRSGPGVL